jgi:hypothetical protein
MTWLETVTLIAVLIVVPGALYGLHRLALFLESQNLLYYWHKQPQSGWLSASLTPLQELMQPEVRHVATVKDESQANDQAGDGL